MVDFYRDLIKSENCEVEFVFSNDPKTILNYTNDVLNCDIHTRLRTKKMLKDAVAGHYAVGQFNINNLEWTKAILQTAEELKSPVILGVSEGAGKYMCGFKTVAAMVSNMIDELGITVPVALHLDHGSYEGAKKCIEAGFSSIMFDGSHYPIEENIEKTKELVNFLYKSIENTLKDSENKEEKDENGKVTITWSKGGNGFIERKAGDEIHTYRPFENVIPHKRDFYKGEKPVVIKTKRTDISGEWWVWYFYPKSERFRMVRAGMREDIAQMEIYE